MFLLKNALSNVMRTKSPMSINVIANAVIFLTTLRYTKKEISALGNAMGILTTTLKIISFALIHVLNLISISGRLQTRTEKKFVAASLNVQTCTTMENATTHVKISTE